MKIRLDRAEFWLLSVLTRFPVPLSAIGLPEDPGPNRRTTIVEFLNRQGSGRSTEALSRTIAAMVRRAWLEVCPPILQPDAPSFLPASTPLASELRRRGNFADSYRLALTPAGGQVWENFARPRWEYFIDDIGEYCSDVGDERLRREIIAVDPAFLQRYMSAIRDETEIVPDSESLDVQDDWEMTYWKPPVTAHRWRFIGRTREQGSERYSMRMSDWWCEWR